MRAHTVQSVHLTLCPKSKELIQVARRLTHCKKSLQMPHLPWSLPEYPGSSPLGIPSALGVPSRHPHFSVPCAVVHSLGRLSSAELHTPVDSRETTAISAVCEGSTHSRPSGLWDRWGRQRREPGEQHWVPKYCVGLFFKVTLKQRMLTFNHY